MIKTRLIATVGPACRTPEVLVEMIRAGVDLFRFNFSHGTLEEHRETLDHLRRITAELSRPVATLGDLCGPKIRLGRIPGGQRELHEGELVTFVHAPGEGVQLTSNYEALIDDVEVGDRVLLDDGRVHLRAVSKHADALLCRCEVGGVISDHKGVNLPDTAISAPPLTDKDLTDLDWAVENHFDYVALSFVRHPDDIRALRERLHEKDPGMRIIAKIEKPQAVEHIDAITELSDAVMVARGDLGVEMDLARIPLVQKEITLLARRAGKPVIIATQMLQSMVEYADPTRAEVSDVANAILDGADAVMLSAESAIGRYPVRAVRQLRAIAEQTESFGHRYEENLGVNQATDLPVETAILQGVSAITRKLDPTVVAVWTESGLTAVLLSKYRLPVPVVAITGDERCYRQLAICYGIVPVCQRRVEGFSEMLAELDRILVERHLARHGDRILIADDAHPEIAGETDALYIHVVVAPAG